MIVLSVPRCGATAFAMAYAEELGVPFFGEMSCFMNDDYQPGFALQKRRFHEAGINCQPTRTAREFYLDLKNSHKGVWLANPAVDCTPILPFADKIILRKNVVDSVGSLLEIIQLEFGHENYPHWAQDRVDALIKNHSIMLDWSYHTEFPIFWYEDCFPGMTRSYDISALGMNLTEITAPYLEKYKISEKMTLLGVDFA